MSGREDEGKEKKIFLKNWRTKCFKRASIWEVVSQPTTSHNLAIPQPTTTGQQKRRRKNKHEVIQSPLKKST
jgi:hypothetical protein